MDFCFRNIYSERKAEPIRRDMPVFSMKTVYALRALQFLAERYETRHVLISEISKTEKIPKKFLETILLALKNEGILTSKIGKGGGYLLAMPPAKINLADVIKALEGNIALIPCADGDNSQKKCEHCDIYHSCGTRLVMTDVSENLAASLQEKTVADLVEETKKARQESAGSFDYMI